MKDFSKYFDDEDLRYFNAESFLSILLWNFPRYSRLRNFSKFRPLLCSLDFRVYIIKFVVALPLVPSDRGLGQSPRGGWGGGAPPDRPVTETFSRCFVLENFQVIWPRNILSLSSQNSSKYFEDGDFEAKSLQKLSKCLKAENLSCI